MAFLKKVIENFKSYDIIKSFGSKRGFFEKAKSYGLIFAGTFICAVGINLFFVPADIVSGGVSGVALIAYRIFGVPMGVFMLFVNIPLFFVGIRFLGGSFGLKTFIGTIALSFFIDVTEGIGKITDDLMLCSCFGGMLSGVGTGMVFFSGASSGGTDVLARLFNKLFPFLDVGKWLFVVDFFIIALGSFAFKNYERSLFGIVALFVNVYMVDLLISGANFAKIVYIISPEHKKIAKAVIHRLNRGVTGIYSKGVYKNSNVLMLMCVVKKLEVSRLKKIVTEVDPNAFIILTQAREVSGEGFKKYPEG